MAGRGRVSGFYFVFSREPKLNSASFIILIEGAGLLTYFSTFFGEPFGDDSVGSRGIGDFSAKLSGISTFLKGD